MKALAISLRESSSFLLTQDAMIAACRKAAIEKKSKYALEHFQAKWIPVRVKQKPRAPFRYNRNGKSSSSRNKC
jgi:hypothetical protein